MTPASRIESMNRSSIAPWWSVAYGNTQVSTIANMLANSYLEGITSGDSHIPYSVGTLVWGVCCQRLSKKKDILRCHHLGLDSRMPVWVS